MRARLQFVALVVAGTLAAAPAAGQPIDGGADAATDAGAVSAALDAGAPDAEVARLLLLASRVRDLRTSTLELSIDPADLFTVPLSDPRQVLVEVRRLTAVVEAATTVADPGATADAGARATTKKRSEIADAGPDASIDGGADAGPTLDEQLWSAQVELDRERLAFLALPAAERTRLLDAHATRQKELEATAVAKKAADTRLEAAAEARRNAEEQLRLAKSEAAKLVARERARLLGVKEQLAAFDSELLRDEDATAVRAEEVLAWRRRVAEHADKRSRGDALPEDTDRLYAELVALLRGKARTGLAEALAGVNADSRVPDAGPDSLDAGGALIDRTDIDRLRGEVEAQTRALRAREAAQRWSLASVFLEEVESLNRDRLALYPFLSSERANDLTSFSAEGIAQGRAEICQVALILRHQLVAGRRWLSNLRGGGVGLAGVLASFSILKILALFGALFWWRRRAVAVFQGWTERVGEARKRSVRRRWRWVERAVSVLRRVHRPAEWLLLAWLALRFAGPKVGGLLEAQLGWIVVGWSLGGVLVVNAVDALASEQLRPVAGEPASDLRLRSLRLVGRVVVAVGLTLGLTAALVGKGTIYSWVLTTCWVAAVPVVLVLVAWWRETIYVRLEPRRKKSPFAQWVAEYRRGWPSFPLALVAAAFLMGHAIVRAARAYLGEFTVTRRVLAYWFRRGVTKQSRGRDEQLEPLDPDTYAALDPERTEGLPLLPVAGDELDRILAGITTSSGGVLAVVGERGSGKSTLLQRVVDGRTDVVTVDCAPGGFAPLRAAIARALHLDPDAADDAIGAKLDALGPRGAIVVDNAQRLVHSKIGGLDELDALLALARASSTQATWLIGVGAVTWRFIERARGSRPLFDEVISVRPWSEERIAELLKQRSDLAELSPRFDRIAAESPSDDEVERAEQIARAEANYYRLLWDYAGGNPAVALHFWRESLRVDPDGHHVVQLFSAPDTTDLERLPDPALFTLRAVLQLELASQPELVASTGLAPVQVGAALRHALFRGYIEEKRGRYRVGWTWYRAISGFLVRRHLIEDPQR